MRVINVASVPQRSPFRYPGGKTWLVPTARLWLTSIKKPRLLIEPFAGGGIISLTAVDEQLVGKAMLVELDADISAVWKTIAAGNGPKLGQRIGNFDLTKAKVKAELATRPRSDLRRAFQTILRNRVNRGGIIAPGAGLIKEGEDGRGLKSRWYPDTLNKRLLAIDQYRDRLQAVEGDGLEIMKTHIKSKSTAFFIDPPYTVSSGKQSGSRLYLHSRVNHDKIFELAGRAAGDVLMTYDNTGEVIELAEANNLDTQPIAMKNTHHAKMTELLVGKNLDWFRKQTWKASS